MKVGDNVRLNKKFRAFQKGYLPGWTEEVFVVRQVKPGPPLTATDLDPTGDVFWQVDPDSLKLSCFCNWVFSYVNESFEEAYGSAERPLFVFSNLVESSTYAEQITNILRDVPYKVQQKCYEMDRMHYMSLRSELVDIIEIAIKEDGSSPHFHTGNTILTLHFKYEP